jgi:hypothetical protein
MNAQLTRLNARQDAIEARNYPREHGWLEGSIRTAIIRLEHGFPDEALDALRLALECPPERIL